MKKRTILRALEDFTKVVYTIPPEIEDNYGIKSAQVKIISIFSPDPTSSDIIFFYPILTLYQRFGLTSLVRMVSDLILSFNWTKGMEMGIDSIPFGDIEARGNLFGRFEEEYKKKEVKPLGMVIKYISGEFDSFPYHYSVLDLLASVPEKWKEGGCLVYDSVLRRGILEDLTKDINRRKSFKEFVRILNEANKHRKV